MYFITFLEQVVYGHQFMNLAGDNLTNVSLFEEHCENLLSDLIRLSLSRYDKVMLEELICILVLSDNSQLLMHMVYAIQF